MMNQLENKYQTINMNTYLYCYIDKKKKRISKLKTLVLANKKSRSIIIVANLNPSKIADLQGYGKRLDLLKSQRLLEPSMKMFLTIIRCKKCKAVRKSMGMITDKSGKLASKELNPTTNFIEVIRRKEISYLHKASLFHWIILHLRDLTRLRDQRRLKMELQPIEFLPLKPVSLEAMFIHKITIPLAKLEIWWHKIHQHHKVVLSQTVNYFQMMELLFKITI